MESKWLGAGMRPLSNIININLFKFVDKISGDDYNEIS